LAAHRRDAALDRGNRRRCHEITGRAPAKAGDLKSFPCGGRDKGRSSWPLWTAPHPLVLASKSEIRGKILAAGRSALCNQADPHRRTRDRGQSRPYRCGLRPPRFWRAAKADAAAAITPGRLVLGADQTLALGAERFSKPADRAAAARNSYVAYAAKPMNCIPPWRWCATVRCCLRPWTPRG